MTKSNGSTKKIITICSSAYFYKHVLEIEKELKKLGFSVKIPKVARKMGRKGDFDVSKIRTWLTNHKDYKIKTALMKEHFRKIVISDAILVLNNEKNGITGYIGGNVLMEMLLAFLHKKPIFVYDPINYDLNVAEEVYGLNPIFINRDLNLLTRKVKPSS
jgi:hypothetical protein